MIRALHVIAALRNSSGPTQGVVNLTEALAELGCSVDLYHLTYNGMDPVRPASSLVRSHGFPRTFSRVWGYSRSLGKSLRRTIGDFDVVHIHGMWQYPTWAACRECRRQRVPYVIAPHGAFEPWCLRQNAWAKRVYYRLVERAGLTAAAAVHAVSEQERQNLERLGVAAHVTVISNGIGKEFFSAPIPRSAFRRRYGLGERTPLVLFLSRLHPKKGLDVLTESFAQVLRRVPEAKLVIAGWSVQGYAKEVAGMAERHGIAQHTILTGDLRGHERLAAYHAADVFVLPSRSENFGIVVAEAMGCGVPVVVSKETPWQHVEEHNAGRWVALDPTEFARHITEILENPELGRQMGENGRALVREKYTWDRIAKKTLALYESIAAG